MPLVRYAKNQTSAASVGERRELVGEVVAAGTYDTVAAEPHFLQLEIRVFTEGDLFPQA